MESKLGLQIKDLQDGSVVYENSSGSLEISETSIQFVTPSQRIKINYDYLTSTGLSTNSFLLYLNGNAVSDFKNEQVLLNGNYQVIFFTSNPKLYFDSVSRKSNLYFESRVNNDSVENNYHNDNLELDDPEWVTGNLFHEIMNNNNLIFYQDQEEVIDDDTDMQNQQL